MRDYRVQSVIAGGTSGVVLTLAALGIVGVMALMVATRTRELAIRMALGATRERVLRTILADVLKLVAPGVAGGLVVATIMFRTILSMYPLGAVAPMVYLLAAAVGFCVALIASLPSARRAASVEPMIVMRSE